MGFGGDYGVYHSAFDSFYLDDRISPIRNLSITWRRPSCGARWRSGWPMLMVSLSTTQNYANQIREYFDESIRLARHRHLDSAIDEKSINEAVKSFFRRSHASLKKRDRN